MQHCSCLLALARVCAALCHLTSDYGYLEGLHSDIRSLGLCQAFQVAQLSTFAIFLSATSCYHGEDAQQWCAI